MKYYAIVSYPESRPGDGWSDFREREISRTVEIYRNRKEAEREAGPEDRIVALEVGTVRTWRRRP